MLCFIWVELQMVVVHPPGRDLCVRWGKGEKELGIISITVVMHAMSRNDRTKGPCVHRGEDWDED